MSRGGGAAGGPWSGQGWGGQQGGGGGYGQPAGYAGGAGMAGGGYGGASRGEAFDGVACELVILCFTLNVKLERCEESLIAQRNVIEQLNKKYS